MSAPTLTLNDRNRIPVVGLGTSGVYGDAITQAVKDAIDVGYRHIDCAYAYKNERNVGIAIKAKIADGTVKRSDLFLTSKLWCTFHRAESVEVAIRKSLTDLQLDYLDLYVIHSPMAFKINESQSKENLEFSDYDYVLTWKAMEAVAKKGLAWSIGLSNFNKRQIERVLERAEILPVVNQVECHPYLTQTEMIQFCHSKGIQVISYCPLVSPERMGSNKHLPKLLNEKILNEIAEKYSKSPAQIALRWQIQRGLVVIPKSVHKNRQRENIGIFDFELTKNDMDAISALNSNLKVFNFAE
uniref:NADP-dependent oxidoreductase domain-containing protein n=3 Tax=Photinus pyralis TaxID=7054 RepID=A0A1Y1K9I4_PHOPY